MPNAMVLLDLAGPLPVSATFESPVDGDVTFVLAGTARTESAANLTGINLYLDGAGIGNTAMCWANQNNNHMAMRPTFIPYTISSGTHTVEIQPAYGAATVTDVNDYFQVTILY